MSTHVSEMRLQNMLEDYWLRHAEAFKANELGQMRFYYFPSCPEVTAEFEQ